MLICELPSAQTFALVLFTLRATLGNIGKTGIALSKDLLDLHLAGFVYLQVNEKLGHCKLSWHHIGQHSLLAMAGLENVHRKPANVQAKTQKLTIEFAFGPFGYIFFK